MRKFVVTISAPDAAGGGVIVPLVAEQLGVPHQPLSAPSSVPGAGDDALDDEAFREGSERLIEELHDAGGVLRDGAAPILLAGDPSVLRVRLDGPLDARARQGAEASGQSEADTRALLEERDRSWAAFYRTYYDTDAADQHWYHMVLDSTALDFQLCADLIVVAARRLLQRKS